MGGRYDLSGGSSGAQLKFNHGGSNGAPITVTSAPGQTATLVGGIVYIPHGSDYVTLTNVHINTHGQSQPGVEINGANDALTYSDITNLNSEYSCVMLGSDTGYGAAASTLIEGDVIHQCGHNSLGNQDHGIYVDNVSGATITNNIFWGIPDGWGIQVYPHARSTQVTHNVIDGNGGGVVFGGNTSSTSDDNVVAYNVITNSSHHYGVEDWWGGAVGSGNVAKNNCISHSGAGSIETPEVGFTAHNNRTASNVYVNERAHDYILKAGDPCLGVVGYDTAAMLAGKRVQHHAKVVRKAGCLARITRARQHATGDWQVAVTGCSGHRGNRHGRRRGRRHHR